MIKWMDLTQLLPNYYPIITEMNVCWQGPQTSARAYLQYALTSLLSRNDIGKSNFRLVQITINNN